MLDDLAGLSRFALPSLGFGIFCNRDLPGVWVGRFGNVIERVVGPGRPIIGTKWDRRSRSITEITYRMYSPCVSHGHRVLNKVAGCRELAAFDGFDLGWAEMSVLAGDDKSLRRNTQAVSGTRIAALGKGQQYPAPVFFPRFKHWDIVLDAFGVIDLRKGPAGNTFADRPLVR